MTNNLEKKINHYKELFPKDIDPNMRYQQLIMLAKTNHFSQKNKIQENIIEGCQSVIYLHAFLKEGKIYFEASADSLVLCGITRILTDIFSGLEPKKVLTSSPDLFKDMGLDMDLSPNRSSGVYSLYMAMKKKALELLTKKF